MLAQNVDVLLNATEILLCVYKVHNSRNDHLVNKFMVIVCCKASNTNHKLLS